MNMHETNFNGLVSFPSIESEQCLGEYQG